MITWMILNAHNIEALFIILLAVMFLLNSTLPRRFRLICSLLLVAAMVANSAATAHINELQSSNASMIRTLTGTRALNVTRNEAVLNDVCRNLDLMHDIINK